MPDGRVGEEFQFLKSLRQLVEDRRATLEQGATVGRGFYAVAAAIEKPNSEPAFYVGNCPRYCRLGNCELGGGLGHASPPRDDEQDLQVAQFEAPPGLIDGGHIGVTRMVMSSSLNSIGRLCPPPASFGNLRYPSPPMMTRRYWLAVSAGSAAVGFVPQVLAQQRVKAARILTGFMPGLPDTVARHVASQMKDYASSIVVETRPGASGRVAVEAVKNASADGSVILLAPLGFMTLFPHIYKTLGYQPRDFIPVSTVASFATVLTVGPKVPGDVLTVADFVGWCRENPRNATFGTPGVGTSLHFIGAMLGRTARFEFVHVPYQGGAAAHDVQKGEIASAILPIGSSLGLIRAGSVRALATTGPRRSPFLVDVPTMAEAGYPELEDVTWYGFFVPAKTPADIVESLNDGIQEALRVEEVKAGLAKLSVEVDAISKADFARLIASESDRWKVIVQATGFTPSD